MERLNFDKSAKNKILEILRSGGVVLLPFDTSYGLAADSTNYLAVDRIFKIKHRDRKKPISVVVGSLDMAKKYCQVDERQFNKYFPGPFTLIFKTTRKGQSLATQKDYTQAIRMPDNKFLLDLAERLDRPFTATSANLAGQANIFSAEEFLEQVGDKVELVVDGGKLPVSKSSTIIDFSKNKKSILRH